MIKNIIFDIGNVLVDFDSQTYLKGFGFAPEKEKRIRGITFDGPIWREYDRGVIPVKKLREKLAALALPEDREDVLQVFDRSHETIHRRDFAIPWILSLQEQGLKTWYLSNYSDWMIQRTQKALDFLPYLHGGLFSCEVGQIKPEPEIFQSFLQRFPEIRPDESVFFDDSPTNIQAACTLGFHGIVFRNQEQASKELAAYTEGYAVCTPLT
ncbi:MAG: HAD family phosphatase [Lachnospiraceae bacterium]|nr:HAD family phosphatase [Lachnospiraceae bacterium]